MKSIVFDMSTMHRHGSAFYDFLRLRKRFFIDNLGWTIPSDGTVEMDQYDTPLAHYSLVESDGVIIGGARCQPVDSVWGPYSCMIKDAARGLLDDIPSDLFKPSMSSPTNWEGTRLVVSDQVLSVLDRTRCLALIIDGLMRIIDSHGGTSLITLSPTALYRTTKIVGLKATQVSRPYISGDGREYALFASRVERALPQLKRFGIDPDTFSVADPAKTQAMPSEATSTENGPTFRTRVRRS
ncbi:MAG: acyl-homoserine-lactone synthase [Pseudomonadota bacterium]